VAPILDSTFQVLDQIDREIDIRKRNHVKLGVSLRILYCVVDTGYGLDRFLGDCRPALPKGRKYQMVKTQTESHNYRPIV
jgi:hypothetical protein